jgi:hypothetical protein
MLGNAVHFFHITKDYDAAIRELEDMKQNIDAVITMVISAKENE